MSPLLRASIFKSENTVTAQEQCFYPGGAATAWRTSSPPLLKEFPKNYCSFSELHYVIL
jgi:hypothetical protein